LLYYKKFYISEFYISKQDILNWRLTLDPIKQITEAEKAFRAKLVGLSFILFTVFLLGMFWLYTNPAMSVGLTLSYAAGLSMIVLPCTFPLVFVIVPLSMGHEYKKGFTMALLFSIGLIITLTLYGVVVAIAGRYIGVTRVQQAMYLAAGLAAFLFGLSELRLIKFSFPTYGGATPQIITRQGDYLKAFFLGLFLGNAGVACPNPATYVILTYIATTGSVITGATLQFVNGVGRATPLIFLSILGIVGVNATGWLVSKKETIDKLTGWGLVVFGAIIIVIGGFGHNWLLITPLHEGWNAVFAGASGGLAEYECCVEPACTECLTNEMYPDGSCICRKHAQRGHYGLVCNQCKVGLGQGKDIFKKARATAPYAIATIILGIVTPILWYFKKKPFEKKEGENE
jgi:cytochrome c-type biogenesis protein